MKQLVYYHSHCKDGICSAAIMSRYFKSKGIEDVKFIPSSYAHTVPDPKDFSGAEVFIVDCSFNAVTLSGIAENAIFVTLIDHHKAAMEQLFNTELPENVKIIFDTTRSGAALTLMYTQLLGGENLGSKDMVQYIEDYDLWKFNLEDTHAVSAYLDTVPKELEYWVPLLGTFDTDYPEIVVKGTAILDYQQLLIDTAIAPWLRYPCFVTMQNEDKKEFTVPIINSTVLASRMGNELAVRSGTGLALIYGVTSDGMYRWYSIRSSSVNGEPPVDVAAIARHYGGNGHPSAAGFRLHIDDNRCI